MNYCGIDLHSNNCVVIVSDEDDRIVYQKRLPNELAQIAVALEPYQHDLVGVVVEDLQLVLACDTCRRLPDVNRQR
jgi:transposase